MHLLLIFFYNHNISIPRAAGDGQSGAFRVEGETGDLKFFECSELGRFGPIERLRPDI